MERIVWDYQTGVCKGRSGIVMYQEEFNNLVKYIG